MIRHAYPDTVTTTIFISNLHCPSCVDSITNSLGAFQPAPDFIAHSIVSHSVTLRHSTSITVEEISASLDAAGFEVHSVFQGTTPIDGPVEVRSPVEHDREWQASLDQAVSKWACSRSRVPSRTSKSKELDMTKQQKHVEQCEQCKEEAGGISLMTNEKCNVAAHSKPISDYDGLIDEDQKTHLADSFVVVDSLDAPTLFKASLSLEGMTCSSCVSSITRAVQNLPYVRSIDVNLLTNSGTVVFEGTGRELEIVQVIEDTGFDATVEKLTELQYPASRTNPRKSKLDRWKATYVIGGMTCSACVGNVTEALRFHPWIVKVDVNLVSNSATVLFSGKDHLPEIKETIEDAGFEATLDNVQPEHASTDEQQERWISINIAGMFCHHCPERIMTELREAYQGHPGFEILDPVLTQKQSILHVKYIPKPPDVTVRHIFHTISSLDDRFTPSVHHPPTIEERSREMHQQERQRILFRLLLSIIVGIPSFVLGIVFMSLIDSKHPIRHYVMQPMWAGNVTRLSWALFILATPVYFFAADTFHRRALKEIRAMWRPGSRTPFLQRFYRFGSMNMLISLGTTIAYLASVVELGLAATKKTSGAMSDSYFDSVVFLTMFLLIGRFLEAYSKAKTGDAVTSLGKLRPEEAVLADSESGDQKIPTDLLEIEDVVRVHHGTSPPFDGILVEGSSDFDESSLTGESRPVKKAVGDTVYSGTINKGPPIKIKLTSISGSSMLDQIISVVREGQTKRAPVERVADLITSHFVPFVVLIAIVTWLTWLILGTSGAIPEDWKSGGSGGWALWSLRFAIAVFVIACPCGIGLAAPTALFVGGGLAAKHGILVKGGGEAFQEASSLDCIVFDKTGTLTQGGDPAVTDHQFAGTLEQSVVTGMVKALEENSNHPIASALVRFCNNQPHEMPKIVDVDEVPGKGLKGTFKTADQEVTAIIGNEAYMKDYGVQIQSTEATVLQTWKESGKSIALIATLSTASAGTAEQPSAWELSGIFAIADPLRPEASSVIRSLKKRGIDIWMLSGDNPITANAVGLQVGIPPENIIAGVLPDQKAEKIKYLQKTLKKKPRTSLFRNPFSQNRNTSKRATIAMVGDGINDAPALSTADLSIAIGSGSDVAISSSSFILITSHLGSLLTLLDLSRVVFRRVWFNFGWALIYNMIAMPVAAGVLYPITTGAKPMDMHHNGIGMQGGMGMEKSGKTHIRLDPVWASLAMALSSVSVVLSSLALRTRIPGVGFRAKKHAV